ncbi:MAG: indole-3-glycerol phosphate synthase TrpC [Candidatus Marinimicrobia bacterium]|nr:indole-3-glycerol phosphate synthase TrpC [Candidatus Neomarinimicrobiota bacterium]
MNKVMTILDKIIEQKKQEVANAQQRRPLKFLQSQIINHNRLCSLRQKMKVNRNFQFICEIKKASPSRGIIKADFDPINLAVSYAEAGADAISVLTDEHFFQGRLDYLPQIRKKVALPLLRKDFIIDPYQIYESCYYQADLILLIARILSRQQVIEFIELADKLSLEVLLELANENDLAKIPLDRRNLILAINNRNLETFEVDLNNSLRLKPLFPDDIPVISASGINTAEECRRLAYNGFAGVLIGESLMRSPSPAVYLSELKKGLIDAC